MAKWATGRRSLAISDRSGQALPYDEMVKEWNGSLVHYSEFEPKHPQIRRKKNVSDAIALQNTRPQRFQNPRTVADNDTTLADSGGTTVGVANLTLPGDFAFRTETFQSVVANPNDFKTTVSSMTPEDPSLQNKRRQLNSIIGNVTVSIS